MQTFTGTTTVDTSVTSLTVNTDNIDGDLNLDNAATNTAKTLTLNALTDTELNLTAAAVTDLTIDATKIL